jgi:hypothetical protein
MPKIDLRVTAKQWLAKHRRLGVLRDINIVEKIWIKKGKATHRNWWAVLAGKPDGTPYIIEGIKFPIIREAVYRQHNLASAKPSKLLKSIAGTKPAEIKNSRTVGAKDQHFMNAILILEKFSLLTKAEATRAMGRLSRWDMDTKPAKDDTQQRRHQAMVMGFKDNYGKRPTAKKSGR